MEVEGTWYKVLKAATGAVFNIKQTSAEILLGVPPLEIQNRVNSIKHMLKMNILPSLQDPSKELITIQLEDNTFSPTTSKTKDVFNFLKWKQNRLPKYFSINERNILSYNLACSYSKPLMELYIEHLWQILLKNQYQIEGCTEAPNVNSEKLVFPPNTTRLLETLVMSLFYPNNLLFDFLNRYNPIKIPL